MSIIKSLAARLTSRLCLRLLRAYCKYHSGCIAFGKNGIMLAVGLDLESVAFGADDKHENLQVTLRQPQKEQEEASPEIQNILMQPGSSVNLSRTKLVK